MTESIRDLWHRLEEEGNDRFDMRPFGYLVRATRLTKGWSLQEAAGRVGIDYPGLSKLERGLTNSIRTDTLRKLVRGLDIPVLDVCLALGLLETDHAGGAGAGTVPPVGFEPAFPPWKRGKIIPFPQGMEQRATA